MHKFIEQVFILCYWEKEIQLSILHFSDIHAQDEARDKLNLNHFTFKALRALREICFRLTSHHGGNEAWKIRKECQNQHASKVVSLERLMVASLPWRRVIRIECNVMWLFCSCFFLLFCLFLRLSVLVLFFYPFVSLFLFLVLKAFFSFLFFFYAFSCQFLYIQNVVFILS